MYLTNTKLLLYRVAWIVCVLVLPTLLYNQLLQYAKLVFFLAFTPTDQENVPADIKVSEQTTIEVRSDVISTCYSC